MAKSSAEKLKKAPLASLVSSSSHQKTVKGNKLTVKVFSPYQTYYQGEAVSLSATNKAGPFDVLASHANFFSLLTAGDVVIETGYARLAFPVNRGVIKVTDNQVTVFVDV